jgi:hypothetical protein
VHSDSKSCLIYTCVHAYGGKLKRKTCFVWTWVATSAECNAPKYTGFARNLHLFPLFIRFHDRSSFEMTPFWRIWFFAWVWSIGIFGAVIAGGAFEATSGPIAFVYHLLQGFQGPVVLFNATLRFSLGVMGAVSLGWAVMLHFIVAEAIRAGKSALPLWNAISAGMATWFIIDCMLSIATGFGLNVVPNVLLTGMYVIGRLVNS